MRNRRKDNKPTEDPEDVTSWDIPSQVDADQPQESTFFVPPPSSSLDAPVDLPRLSGLPDLPDLPNPADSPIQKLPESLPQPPSPPLPPTPPPPPANSWVEAAASAEVRDFPESVQSATPYRPNLPEPGSIIDLTSRTEHPYDDIFSLGSQSPAMDIDLSDSETIDLTDSSSEDKSSEDTDTPVRELPNDLRSALQIATTPSMGLPIIDEPNTAADEYSAPVALVPPSLTPPETARAAANAQLPSILTVDVLGSAPTSLSGLFTDVLTDNGFDVDSVSETSIMLTRDSGTVTIDIAEQSAGCVVEVVGLPSTAIRKLMVAGLLQIGYVATASRETETVLRDEQKSLVRVVSI